MRHRYVNEINAGSMADIAFQLLIFFVVATTIDIDQGILRKLPPYEKKPVIEKSKIRNTFVVLINNKNELFVQNKHINISQLKATAKEFIENPNNDTSLPEKTAEDLPYLGKIYVTKNHVISIQNDRGTSYASYLAVQNQLAAAYNELKDELSLRYFKTNYSDLDEKRRKSIDEVYPLKISEANPVDIITKIK